jgi:hypothetical protein
VCARAPCHRVFTCEFACLHSIRVSPNHSEREQGDGCNLQDSTFQNGRVGSVANVANQVTGSLTGELADSLKVQPRSFKNARGKM